MPLVTGAGCMIALLSAMNAVAEWRGTAPNVGDIVAFSAGGQPMRRQSETILVFSTAHQPCVLDTATMHRFGGSFLISARADGASGDYVVHWAGARTTAGRGDCGPHADLLLNRTQLDLLEAASAAIAPPRPDGAS